MAQQQQQEEQKGRTVPAFPFDHVLAVMAAEVRDQSPDTDRYLAALTICVDVSQMYMRSGPGHTQVAGHLFDTWLQKLPKYDEAKAASTHARSQAAPPKLKTKTKPKPFSPAQLFAAVDKNDIVAANQWLDTHGAMPLDQFTECAYGLAHRHVWPVLDYLYSRQPQHMPEVLPMMLNNILCQARDAGKTFTELRAMLERATSWSMDNVELQKRLRDAAEPLGAKLSGEPAKQFYAWLELTESCILNARKRK